MSLTRDVGPAGKLIDLLDRHPFRPAHIHIMVRSQPPPPRRGGWSANTKLTGLQAGNDKYTPLVTQIFDKETKYLENDSVFAVKDDLVVDFKPVTGDAKATLELEYDIRLAVAKA